MSLLQSTRKLLDHFTAKGLTPREIADASEGEVDREWLYKFARGAIPDPGVTRLQKLHDYLKNLRDKRN